MRFLFILFAIEVLTVRNYCFISLSRIKREKKANEDLKNDTSSDWHISKFTDPITGENPYVDVKEATDNNRIFNILHYSNVTILEDPLQITEGRPNLQDELNGPFSRINRMRDKLAEQDTLLMDGYSLDTESESRNISQSVDSTENPRKHFLIKSEAEFSSKAEVDILTPTSFVYVNVTTSLVNTLSSPSIETYLIVATSIIFLMAAIIIVFGIWKWRFLGRQQRMNNDKRNAGQNHHV